MEVKPKREMPTCPKCELQHWYFQACSDGKKFVRVGYDTLRHETDYRRTQFRERPRLHYKDQHEG